MSDFWQSFRDRSASARAKLAALPWREKLRRVDAMMDRQYRLKRKVESNTRAVESK